VKNQTTKLFVVIFGTVAAAALMLLATYGFVSCMDAFMIEPAEQREQSWQQREQSTVQVKVAGR